MSELELGSLMDGCWLGKFKGFVGDVLIDIDKLFSFRLWLGSNVVGAILSISALISLNKRSTDSANGGVSKVLKKDLELKLLRRWYYSFHSACSRSVEYIPLSFLKKSVP